MKAFLYCANVIGQIYNKWSSMKTIPLTIEQLKYFVDPLMPISDFKLKTLLNFRIVTSQNCIQINPTMIALM